MFTLDMRLAMDGSTCLQSLTISYGENSHTWDCVNHTFFNVTVTSYPATEIYITFQSNITLSDGYLWLGFEGRWGHIFMQTSRQYSIKKKKHYFTKIFVNDLNSPEPYYFPNLKY